MSKNLHHGEGYFDIKIDDIRDTRRFKEFKSQVLEFIKEKLTVNWRMLNDEFDGESYWLSLAVEELNGRGINWERERIPERISFVPKNQTKKVRGNND